MAIYGEFSFLGYFLLGLFFFLFWFSCLGIELVFFPVVVLCCLVEFCFSILVFLKENWVHAINIIIWNITRLSH